MSSNPFFPEVKERFGFGCMRLPMIGDEVDIGQFKQMVDRFLERGFNYFDTAHGYIRGKSELALREGLTSRYPRERYILTDKLTNFYFKEESDIRPFFESQLAACGVDYFDFYLFHNVCEMNVDAYLDPKFGIYDYLMEQKKQGRIRHLGFSCHGRLDVLKRFLEAYGKDMEFCQLQLNWLDWTFQDARAKVELLREYRIPVWVMEPLRGGRLARLSEKHTAQLKALRPEETVPAWAFRFLQTIPEVTVTLSGMSDMEQRKANLATYETEKPLNTAELAALEEISRELQAQKTLPCTGCRYCVSHCPAGLDIPYLMSLYNEHVLTGGGFIAPMALMAVDKDHWPQACLQCHSCEQVCPQQLKIPEMMESFAGLLG